METKEELIKFLESEIEECSKRVQYYSKKMDELESTCIY